MGLIVDWMDLKRQYKNVWMKKNSSHIAEKKQVANIIST